LQFIEASDGLSPNYRPTLFERLSRIYRARADRARAIECADRAIDLSLKLTTTRNLGYALDMRAGLAREDADLSGALVFYQRAFEAYTNAGREPERASALLC